MCTLVVTCVYAGVFLRGKISELLSYTRDVCLLVINAHRYLARSDTNHHPPTLTHTFTHSRSQCDELSVPVRLGILVSTRFGSPFRGAELGTFSPLSIPESGEQEGKKTDRKREPKTSHDIGEFVFNHLLKYLRCCVRFTIHRALQSPPPRRL